MWEKIELKNTKDKTKTQIKFYTLKSPGIKNVLGEINSILETAREKISDFDYIKVKNFCLEKNTLSREQAGIS